ncbi:CLUMA_CG021410, isoform A [Clunio marinus]|uniref:CLUMA_CG021410, isoform A n=1 Tax=Clunio marinus TaxID=568069 RepID=A0A1J1JAI1_9DIPT|nr:CLUMA_CG021410, isoform A [Clunio marinus]
MLVNCPICSEILLPSDVLYSTPCGHIFHVSCLNRWLSNNNTCPQCRQSATQVTVHRIFLPEVNFQDQDSLIERMNEINRQKIEYENKLKRIEQEKKILETDLKRKKKEYQRVVQRSKTLSKNGNRNIPSRRSKTTPASTSLGSQAHTQGRKYQTDAPPQQKRKRNRSRIQRAKRYFVRKQALHRENNRGRVVHHNLRDVIEERAMEVETVPDLFPLQIETFSEDSQSN